MISRLSLLIEDIDRNGIRGQSRLPPVAAAVPPRFDADQGSCPVTEVVIASLCRSHNRLQDKQRA
jgi:hypothetical protein